MTLEGLYFDSHDACHMGDKGFKDRDKVESYDHGSYKVVEPKRDALRNFSTLGGLKTWEILKKNP